MKNKHSNKYFLFIILIVCSIQSLAQQKISGYITDSKSGEIIAGASVYSKNNNFTSSNNYGYYSIIISNLPDTLLFSSIGYNDSTVVVTSITNKTVNIQLREKIYTIGESVIQGNRTPKKDQIDLVNIPMRRLKFIPNILGENDVMKVISLTPGISTGAEGKSGLYVRGGTPDQNLLLLDGTKMYNSDHLFGYLSVFNPDAIQSFRVYKADFPTKYGGNLSSVVEVDIKAGNKKKKIKELSVGMISSRLLMEGPIKKDTSSYLITGRFGYWTLLSLPTLYKYLKAKRQPESPVKPSFTGNEMEVYPSYLLYDINAKYSTKLKNNDNFYFSMYAGNDFILIKPFPGTESSNADVNLRWGNRTFSTQYTHIFKNDVFSDFSLNFSDYKYNLNVESVQFTQHTSSNTPKKDIYFSKSNSGLKDLNFSWNNSYGFTEKYTIKFGYSFVHHIQNQSFTGGLLDSLIFDASTKSTQNEQNFYLENNFNFTERLSSKIGVRVPLFFAENKTYINYEPRLNLSYVLNEFNSIKLSYSKMTQPIHLLSAAASYDGIKNDVWVSSSEFIAPQESDQISFGWISNVAKPELELKIEAYYKTFSNLIDYKEGFNFAENPSSYEENIEINGIGKAYGLELFVNKSKGRINGWLSYALSWNQRKFDQINLGEWYAHQYSKRHDLSLTATYDLKKERRLSSTFILATGNRLTLPTTLYTKPDGGVGAIYTERNNFILPAYHRLDISFTRKVKTRKKKRDAYWTYSIYNVYAHKNANTIYFHHQFSRFTTPGTNNLNFDVLQRTFISIFPSISYRLKF